MIFPIHLIDNRCGTSERLVSEKYRVHRLHRTELVVVYYLKNLRLVNPVNRLLRFIVVDHDNLLLPHTEEISSGNHPYIIALLIMYREITVSLFRHYLTHLIRVRLCAEGYEPLRSHKKAYRNRLIYKP